MIPRPNKTLNDIAMRLLTHVVPNTTTEFTMTDTAMIAQLLTTYADECERGIATRMADIDEMKSIFTAASDTPISEHLATFCLSQPEDLSLSHVNALHDQGTRLLIQLHEWSEGTDTNLEERIWTYLRNHTERHKYESPLM